MSSRQSTLFKRLDAVFGPAACRLLTRPQRSVSRSPVDDHPGRLLVIRPGGMGDMLMLLPTLDRLITRHPERKIDLLCERRNAGIASLAGLDLTILPYDVNPWRVLRHLRQNTYAAVVDTEQFHHFSAVLSKLSRAPIRIGFHSSPRRNGLYTHLAAYDMTGREDRQFAVLAALAGASDEPDVSMVGRLRDIPLPPLPAALEPMAKHPLLVVHSGGDNRMKRVPAAALAEVCQRAHSELGLNILFVGGQAERPFVEPLRRALGQSCVNACGRLSLSETASACRRAAVFLGPDSGISHLSVALGTPSVTLFGPSDQRKWSAGASSAQTVLRRPLPCSPCAIFGYMKPCACIDCMKEISAESVVEALRERQRHSFTNLLTTDG